MFVQRVRDCDEHSDCCAIDGVQDGDVVWVSHFPSDVNPACRLNVDHPAEDHRSGKGGAALRWQRPTPTEASRLRIPAESVEALSRRATS